MVVRRTVGRYPMKKMRGRGVLLSFFQNAKRTKTRKMQRHCWWVPCLLSWNNTFKWCQSITDWKHENWHDRRQCISFGALLRLTVPIKSLNGWDNGVAATGAAMRVYSSKGKRNSSRARRATQGGNTKQFQKRCSVAQILISWLAWIPYSACLHAH